MAIYSTIEWVCPVEQPPHRIIEDCKLHICKVHMILADRIVHTKNSGPAYKESCTHVGVTLLNVRMTCGNYVTKVCPRCGLEVHP